MDKKYIIIQCKNCKGAGFQKKKIVFSCSFCGTKSNCMHCENIKYKGAYEECDNCCGCGEIYLDNKTKQPTLGHLYDKVIK